MKGRDPWRCAWPRDYCPQARSLLDDSGLCYYHGKLVAGLFDPASVFLGYGIRPSDVLSDEQVTLARTLEALGASKGLVAQALQRRPHPNADVRRWRVRVRAK